MHVIIGKDHMCPHLLKDLIFKGAWVAQSVKRPTLGFGSGHDLMVREFKPLIGLHAACAEPAWDSLSPSLCPSPALACSLFLSK